MNGAPTTYAELIGLLESLPLLAREKRRRHGLTVRAAAKEVGIPFSNLSRFENREVDACLATTVMPILRWVSR